MIQNDLILKSTCYKKIFHNLSSAGCYGLDEISFIQGNRDEKLQVVSQCQKFGEIDQNVQYA
jgi:hypothetical protein